MFQSLYSVKSIIFESSIQLNPVLFSFCLFNTTVIMFDVFNWWPFPLSIWPLSATVRSVHDKTLNQISLFSLLFWPAYLCQVAFHPFYPDDLDLLQATLMFISHGSMNTINFQLKSFYYATFSRLFPSIIAGHVSQDMLDWVVKLYFFSCEVSFLPSFLFPYILPNTDPTARGW